jgi:hypothetical protein
VRVKLAWFLTLKEERKLTKTVKYKVQVLKRTFELKREEVRRACMKLHNEELHNLNVVKNVY